MTSVSAPARREVRSPKNSQKNSIPTRPYTTADFGQRQLGQADCYEESDWNAEQDCACRPVNACEDKGQNSKGVLGGGGCPRFSKKKAAKPNLPDGGKTGNDKENGDEEDTAHGD